jgi:predicted phosphodiesterase
MIRTIFPDLHGEHLDLAAANAFLEDTARDNPDEVVGLGDIIDCGGVFSIHARSFTNEMTESYEDDVAAANWFLDKLMKAAPRAVKNGKIYLIEGNHEQHVERWACSTFASHKDARMLLERFGPDKVLHLKERGIKYFKRSEFYQGISIPGTFRLGKCFFTHGVTHSANAARAHLHAFGASVVFGHVHAAQSLIQRTVTAKGIGAFCPGTLAKLQPLWKHTQPTHWNHGYAIQGVTKSGNFAHFNIPILDGESIRTSVLG